MRYLVGVIVGAIIGYITNWLAIKMLFRPYTEKRILRIKVPFTPGLIPKEKDRIAKNVSESVGEHLLNKESIGRALSEPGVKNKVKISIENKVEEFLLVEGTIQERVIQLFGDKANDLILLGENNVKEKLYNTVKEKAEERVILDILLGEISDILERNPRALIGVIEKVDIKKLSNRLVEVIPKNEIYNFIESAIKDKIGEFEEEKAVIGDILPKETFEAIDNYIINHKEEICLEICNTLRKDDVSYRIKEKIEEHLFGGLKGIVTKFLSVDLVYDKMIGALEAYLADEKNQVIVCKCISNYVMGLGDVKVESFVENMPLNLNKEISHLIGDKGIEIILTDSNLNNIKRVLIDYIDKFESYDLLLKSISPAYMKHIKELLDKFIMNIVAGDKIKSILSMGVSYGAKEILNYDFSGDIGKSKAAKKLVSELIEKNYDKMIDKEIPKILEIVDIPKIIENQINSFEVDYAEKLIVDIANKELKAITWLGALLGGVLGILSPIIGSIKF